MVSCRSRKTGNCSNCSKNKLLQEKPRETFPGSFPIPGSPALCVGQGVGALARTHGNREAPAWHRSGKPFLGLWMRVPDRDGTGRQGTKWHRVPLEIQQKRARLPPRRSRRSTGNVSLTGGPDFDCVSVKVWPCPISVFPPES